jgi:acyl transferase domain-containing protein
LARDPVSACGRTPEDEAAQKAALTDTRAAQPALGVAGLAMAKLLQRHGVEPNMLAGHSYGELVALCIAGALPGGVAPRTCRSSEADAFSSRPRHAQDPGTMAASRPTPRRRPRISRGLPGVVIANENSPEQSVISGPTREVQEAVERLLAASIAAQPIPVACAFHSPLVHGACEAFARDLATVDLRPPALPVYSNTTATVYPGEPDAIRARLAEHIGKPVRFVGEIEAMYADGARVFVEAGPRPRAERSRGTHPRQAAACGDRVRSGPARTASSRSCWRSGSSPCEACRSGSRRGVSGRRASIVRSTVCVLRKAPRRDRSPTTQRLRGRRVATC